MMKTGTPAHGPPRTLAIAIAAKPASVSSRDSNASCSLLSGFRMTSDDVDGDVHDDPHHVDEVPVDAGQLDTVVVLGREVPAEGADRREEQQHQPDEDVHAVQARQAEEGAREGR